MSPDRRDTPKEVLTALPRSRPHRRSDKRGARAVGATTAAPPEKPAGAAKPPRAARPTGDAKPTPATKPTGAAKPTPAAKPTGPAKPTATRKAAAGARPQRPAPLRQPPQPRGLPPKPERATPPSVGRGDVVSTAVQAAAELAEIGLSAGARALRRAVSRLPRP